jgi:hypothetical protein
MSFTVCIIKDFESAEGFREGQKYPCGFISIGKGIPVRAEIPLDEWTQTAEAGNLSLCCYKDTLLFLSNKSISKKLPRPGGVGKWCENEISPRGPGGPWSK